MNEQPLPEDQPVNPPSGPPEANILPSVNPRDLAIHGAISRPVKKKLPVKKIAIWSGSALGVLLIAAGVLFYFLYWQNPNVIISDAIAKLATTDKLKATGKFTTKVDQDNVTVDITSNFDGSRASVKLGIRAEFEGAPAPIELQFDGVYANDGYLYARVGGFEKMIDDLVDDAMEDSVFADPEATADFYGQEVDREGAEKIVRTYILSSISPIVEHIDGQWLKISTKPSEQQSDEAKCSLEVLEKFKTDQDMRREVMSVYRSNRFIFINEEAEVGVRESSTGYEIRLDGQEVLEGSSKFKVAMKETEVAKSLADCNKDEGEDELGGLDPYAQSQGEDDEPEHDTKIVLWVDKGARQLTGLDYTFDSEKIEIEANITIENGLSDSISVPSGARDLEELMTEVMEQAYGSLYVTPDPELFGPDEMQYIQL